jgi:cytochrome d ubiquinol oxidase subunit II
VLTFTGFPSVFAQVGIVLHIPLTLMLVGIVLRGSAFTFRSYGSEHDSAQRRWGRIFAGASLLTPVLLGVSIGAIASGRVGGKLEGDFVQQFVNPWLTPFAFGVGGLALTLFAFLAAVFLTLEAEDPELREDFRRRALAAGVAVFLAAALVLALSYRTAPLMTRGLLGSGWAGPLHLITGLSAIAVLAALWFRRYRLARVGAGLQVSLIFWGWPLSQYPYLLPPDLAISNTAAPPATLRLVLAILLLGSAVLLPSLVYLFRVFKR